MADIFALFDAREYEIWDSRSGQWLSRPIGVPFTVHERDAHTILLRIPGIGACPSFHEAIALSEQPESDGGISWAAKGKWKAA